MKIEEQVLSCEQMAHLKELGVDTSDASMCWIGSCETSDWYLSTMNAITRLMLKPNYKGKAMPAYTVEDLIGKLPKWVEDYELESTFGSKNVGYWGINESAIYSVYYKRFIEGLYELFCWVAENHKELLEVRNE